MFIFASNYITKYEILDLDCFIFWTLAVLLFIIVFIVCLKFSFKHFELNLKRREKLAKE